MKSIKALLLVSILGFSVVACSEDDDNGGSGGGDAAAYVATCKDVCDKQVAQNCSLIGADACKQFCDAFGAATGDCAAKLKALGDCQSKATDVCAGSACSAETSAMNSACASNQ